MKTFVSDISQRSFPLTQKVEGKVMQKALLKFIQKQYPTFESTSWLSINELNAFREAYIESFLEMEIAELPNLQATVERAVKQEALLTQQLESDTNAERTFGQRVADNVASFGGSWTFILSFGAFLLVWIVVNVVFLSQKAFDPFPFILLNLILSCVAALQAPVIMMSQNRQEEKDRDRARKDYLINLKSELEIRMLHEKIDHMLLHQQLQLIEIQQMQVEMMKDILEKLEDSSAGS
jgi:uncharacterized membrane protein